MEDVVHKAEQVKDQAGAFSETPKHKRRGHAHLSSGKAELASST